MSDVQIREVDETDIDTVLAGDIEFEGTLNFKKSLMIKGRFLGDIKAEGELYIDTDAHVEARVEAEVVSLKGTVKGDVFAYSRVELFASAMVDGDITAPDVIMESGCRFNGICRMESPLKKSDTGDAKHQKPEISHQGTK
ncbi:MAG: polymer-forming cytoskeletal protein [Spirochaetia bacterium]|jgi:cytoskeletal protein CcmA (bactofilin family)|nr:polymer-forming cytoskeletal protein [Spirochaetia bacterium]